MYTVQYVLCTVCVEYISNFVDGKSKYLRNLMALFKFHELLAKTGSEGLVWHKFALRISSTLIAKFYY